MLPPDGMVCKFYATYECMYQLIHSLWKKFSTLGVQKIPQKQMSDGLAVDNC
jgi:hypothetical protein